MRCVAIRGHGKDVDNLVVEERPEPEARAEDVRVRVTAAALNRADILQRYGLYPAPPGVPADIPGLEFTGHVDSVGEQVTEWKPGDRVFGIVPGGACAEAVVTHQRLLAGVPRRLDDVQAAAVPEAFISAHDALVTQGGLVSGARVLIHAVAGGIGTAALQIVHLWGARAVGTAGSAEKLERVAALAPLVGIDRSEEDFAARVEEIFGPDAVDLVLDTVGAAYWQRNIRVLRTGGTLVLFGLLGGVSAETPLSSLLFKRLRILGTTLRTRPLEERIRSTQLFARQVLPHLEAGRIVPVVDSVFPLEAVREATGRMEAGGNVGKIVLTFT